MIATRYGYANSVGSNGTGTVNSLWDVNTGVQGGAYFGITVASPGGPNASTLAGGWMLAPTLSQANLFTGFANTSAQAFGVGGLQVALADGSARTISPSISLMTWNTAMCPNDGNPPGSDW